MNREYVEKWIFKIFLFSFIGLIFWLLVPNGGIAMYYILIFGAAFWFLYEYKTNQVSRKAIKLGLFLMVFDWVVENLGDITNLWRSTNSFMFVGAVPIEIMALATVGGAAWAMHFPKKLNWGYVAGDAAMFAVFGMVGERLLIANNQMVYGPAWTSMHALVGYFLTFFAVSFVWYKFILKSKKS